MEHSPAPATQISPTAGSPPRRATSASARWAIVITGLALFMASLDNLVVTTALPVIRVHLHAGLSGLEWTVNAYTLTFAVLLLTGGGLRRALRASADLRHRHRDVHHGLGRRPRCHPSIGFLVAARAVQGAGGAMIMPLSLTLLSRRRCRPNAATGPRDLGRHRRGRGGHRTAGRRRGDQRLVVAVHLLAQRAGGDRARAAGLVAVWPSRRDRASPLDLVGVGARSAPGSSEWSSAWCAATPTAGRVPRCVGSFVVGAVALAGFVAWELRSATPCCRSDSFASRGFTAVNVTALFMSFGMFGSIFFLTQFLQTVQGYSPLAAGVRVLPWTGMPMLAGAGRGPRLAERWGGKPLVVTGLVLQAIGLAWLALVIDADDALRATWSLPFVVSGIGHDAVLRAAGLVGARPRSARPGGRGLGGQQRLPRARRRARDRRPRSGLQRPRRLHLAARPMSTA